MNAQLEEVVEEQQEQVEEIAPEIISEAERFGWVPKEKFRGNESEWVDAQTFVQRGREINPILKANNERLKKEIDALKVKLENASISVKEFKKFQQEAFERKEQEYKSQISSLKAQKKEAIELGDGARVIEIDDQIDEIKEAQSQAKEVVKEQPKQDIQPDPSFLEWVQENSWYGEDKRKSGIADAIAEEIQSEGNKLSNKEFLAEVSKRLDAELNPKQARHSAVEGSGGTRPVAGKKRSYENLPPDAKAACDDFIKRGWIKDKQEYVDKYDWS